MMPVIILEKETPNLHTSLQMEVNTNHVKVDKIITFNFLYFLWAIMRRTWA
jgi:hypothetical protein